MNDCSRLVYVIQTRRPSEVVDTEYANYNVPITRHVKLPVTVAFNGHYNDPLC